MQYDETTSRQIAAHQPPASHHRHGLDSPSTYPTQGQHPAPAHSRPAPEDSRGTPAPRREDRGRQQRQSPETEPRRGRGRKAREGQRPAPAPRRASPATKASMRTEGDPAAPSRCNPPPQPARQQSQRRPGGGRERKERRERREGEERPENDSKRAPPSLHPRQSQRPGAPAILPAVPAYTDRGQPRRAPENRGINSAFVEYAELPLTNAAHAIPGEARQGGYFTF